MDTQRVSLPGFVTGDPTEDPMVFLAPRGNTYHAANDCQMLRRVGAVRVLPESHAISRGRMPCRVCIPVA
jgi:hypothetical protein